jgi:FAD-dependent urate hydroxylase
MQPSETDVAIIGAGPYGLSLATYLRRHGVAHRIFGVPMETCRRMPRGLNLKSLGFATTIPNPLGHPTFPEYCRARGLEDYEPIAFETFTEYGMSVQQHLVPYVEETKVAEVKRSGRGFELTLETGERLTARRVVSAVGLSYFPRMPQILAELPEQLRSHTFDHSDYGRFASSDVAVVGGGSSALEAATLLHECGANVRVLARHGVYWGGHGPRESERSLIDRVRNPITALGHGRDNWILQHVPMLMHYLPSERRLRFTGAHLGPAVAWWLTERARGRFPVLTNTSIVEATEAAGRVRLLVRQEGSAGEAIVVDHVVAGTGYEADVDRLSFLSADIAGGLARYGQAPRLSRHFESSVPGLYFLGLAAAASFGPLVRFIAGAPFAVPRLAAHLAGSRRPAPPTAAAIESEAISR